MNDEPKTRRQKSVDWQNRYLAPVLLPIVMIVVVVAWAAGRTEAWFAVFMLGVLAIYLVSVTRRNRSGGK